QNEALIVWLAVLLDEPAESVEPAVDDAHADVVRAQRKRRAVEPFVRLRVVDVMIVAIDALLAVAAEQMHLPVPYGCPGHLAAGNGKRRLGRPPAGIGGLPGWAIRDVLNCGLGRYADPARLLQAFVHAAMVLMP